MESKTIFTTCPGQFSYAQVFKPRFDDNRTDPKTGEQVPIYSTMFLFDKKEKGFLKRINEAIKAAFDKGVKDGKFNAKSFAVIKKPLRDGDQELADGKQESDIYKGKYFFNAVTTKTKPDTMKAEYGQIVEIDDANEFYSGCIGRLLGTCYPFKVPSSKGIAIGLNGVLKIKDGDRLDGRPDAKSAFDEFSDEGEAADSEDFE